MTMSCGDGVGTPRIAHRAAFVIAGLCDRYSFASTDAIPAQWRRFGQAVSRIPESVGAAAYGAMLPVAGLDDGFDYLAGVEVPEPAGLPTEFSHAEIPAARYAVFEHRGHVSGIKAAWHAVWAQWLPAAGLEVVDAPILFEEYGAGFDPESGQGVVGLWVPVQ